MDGAYRAIADVNPISYLVEGLRELVLTGYSGTAVLQAILIPLGVCAAAVLLALLALRRKLASR
jgi:ABC-2 type transport system permease protein